MWCKSCAEGNEPHVLDIDGLRSENTGKPGCWGHSYEDHWWPCQRKAAEEHAVVALLPRCWDVDSTGRLVQETPVVPGMEAYYYSDIYEGIEEAEVDMEIVGDALELLSVDDLAASREAAEALREKDNA